MKRISHERKNQLNKQDNRCAIRRKIKTQIRKDQDQNKNQRFDFTNTSFQQNKIKFNINLNKPNQQATNRYHTSYHSFKPNQIGSASQVKQITSYHLPVSTRKTQKQRYIDQIKNKVLMSDNFKTRCKTNYDAQRYGNENQNIQQGFAEKSLQDNRIIATQEGENRAKIVITPRVKQIDNKFIEKRNWRLKQQGLIRSRSKTISKDFLMPIISAQSEISRTIQLNVALSHTKLKQSLKQIEKYESDSRQSPGVLNTKRTLGFEDHSPRSRSMTRQRQALQSPKMEQTVMNTAIYEEEVENLTNQFFSQWNKMSLTKSKIYENLRNKFVQGYPQKRKLYPQYQLAEQNQFTEGNFLKKMSLTDKYNIPQINSNDLNIIKSNNSMTNQLSTTQIKQQQQKIQFSNQKKFLQNIFKKAYFWSKTKKKYMSNSTQVEQKEEKMEMIQLKKIQSNLTFMKYISGKEAKHLLNRKRRIKGNNIIKNKDNILNLEKQGSKQQDFLKKCLDDAIEDCIRTHIK